MTLYLAVQHEIPQLGL